MALFKKTVVPTANVSPEFKKAVNEYHAENKRIDELHSRGASLHDKLNSHEAEIQRLANAVTTAQKKVDQKQEVYSQSLSDADYKALDSAMAELRDAEVRHSVTVRTLTPVMKKIEEEVGRYHQDVTYTHNQKRLPYMAAANEVARNNPEVIGLWLFLLQKGLKRDSVKGLFNIGRTDEALLGLEFDAPELESMFDELMKQARA